MAVEAELKRRDPNGALIGWLLNEEGTDPVADAEARTSLASIVTKLGDILTELQQKLEPGGTVALDAGSTVALDAPTLSALEVVTVANPTADPETGLAKDSTLDQILTKLTSIDDALNNTDSTTQAAVASVASGAWTDVVTLNRPNAITVIGFNADPDALVSFDFRYRLAVAGVVKISEVVSANRLSFIPVTIDVPANTDVKVQVRHGEIAAQDFQASIAYRE
jgi:hypothetical protein